MKSIYFTHSRKDWVYSHLIPKLALQPLCPRSPNVTLLTVILVDSMVHSSSLRNYLGREEILRKGKQGKVKIILTSEHHKSKIEKLIYFHNFSAIYILCQGLGRLCIQRVIWTHRTLFFDSLDTHKFKSEFVDDDFS